MSETDELVILSEPRPGVVQLTLARPEKLNAMSAPLVAALHSHLRTIAADPTCRVVVLTGAGRFDAEEALRIGLVTEIAEPGKLSARVTATLDALLAAPPLSLSLTKQGMWLALEIPSFDAMVEVENRQQVLTAATADAREAMASYVGRRAADYQYK